MRPEHKKKAGLLAWQILMFALLWACGPDKDQEVSIDCDMPKAADAYVYPVKPGTPEWVSLQTTTARWEACQIPAEKLKSMTSAGLIESWCDFPFTIDIHTARDFQIGIGYLMTHFSGLQELCTRQDAGEKLLVRYKSMQPACVQQYSDPLSQGNFSLSYPPVELLLAQDIILDKLSRDQKKDLVREALKKYHDKKQYPEVFGLVAGTAFPLLICARTLKNVGYQPFVAELESGTSPILFYFYQTGVLHTPDTNAREIQTILKHAENFLQ